MSVQRFNKSNGDIQPTHIYYDMNLINNDSSYPSLPVRFNYKETRSNYYILSPQDYYMSIVRFYIQTPTLPTFIPQINLNTNGNFGGTYPIQSMSGASNSSSFTVNLYTNIPIVVGTVVFMGYSGGYLNARGADVATGNNYYRVVASSTSSFGITSLTLLNANPVILSSGTYSLGTAVPNNYIGGNTTAFSANGGTQTITYSNLTIASMSFNSSTSQLSLSIPTGANPFSLVGLYQVGDIIYVNNSGLYNGSYTINTVTQFQLICNATSLASVTLPPYVSGGSFTSAGDFYNITPYVVNLQYTNAITMNFSVPVYYTCDDLTQSPPTWNPSNAQALSLTDVTSQYYWIYTFSGFMNMINKALTNAFWGLNGYSYNNNQPSPPLLHMSSGATATTYQPPSISWNSSNGTAVFTADNSAFAISNTYQPIYLYLNQPLSTLLDGMPYVYPNVSPSSNLYSYVNFKTSAGAGLYVVSSYASNGTVTPQYTAIQQYQQISTSGLFNPVSAIVFSSTLLPVNMENVGLPLILNGTSPNSIQVGSSANVFPIVTDFQVPVNATSSYTGDITYVPNGEYRLVDLYGTSPANQIDIQIFWKDQYGLIHPFYVGSGCSGNLKIMFRKKDYNNISLDE